MKRLVFSNEDSSPKNIYVVCDERSIPHIMAWYGAYCAGDRYTVTYDGHNIPMGLNGEIDQRYWSLIEKEKSWKHGKK